MLSSLPNPAVLVNSIQLLEAQASSEIENIVTTSDELFRFADDEAAAADPATREALRYRAGSTPTRPRSESERSPIPLFNWETFIHEPEGLDPLIVMATAHYQFEAIRPFACCSPSLQRVRRNGSVRCGRRCARRCGVRCPGARTPIFSRCCSRSRTAASGR
ncbi:hypothetical protein C5C31_13865 [Rathayibacter rathayi]|uniref:Fic/DOC family N-terminal domain-containing protein n=1 Tax=Rathayibacter rathayi TaxID=33887 RepID=UPI000CE77792|nr:hypothetical protein C5C02_09280 [Rathayibacter rathayi]PPG73398.1 hypothetical protein C5C23_14500 [Rathayibacter rathayi]PPH18469.1 hypothetical protein C5C31_13865 [Rathayibacter rathayi]PPI75543.1 hypothetical protein C5E03_13770 [Rathayibacter rathayi]